MKKRSALLAVLLLLTACGSAPQKPATTPLPEEAVTAETAEAAATPQPTEEPTLPLRWIDRQNDEGVFLPAVNYQDGMTLARYFCFADATETIVGEPLELKNANLELYADEEYLYWMWSGMVTDTPLLLRSRLDGSERTALYEFPQGTALAFWGQGLATDGQALYFRYAKISDTPTVPDVYSLVRLDPEGNSLVPLTTWSPFAGELLGVWNGNLLITRKTLAEDCPLEPVYNHYHVDNLAELEPWMTTSLCAFNPTTGQETVLFTDKGSWLKRILAENALWAVDETQQLICRPLGETQDTVVTQLPQPMQLYGVYAEDILLTAEEDGKDWLYVYDRAAQTLTRSPQRRWMGMEDRALAVRCEAGPGRYLVVDDATTGLQVLAGADGTQYLVDGYAGYAIADRAALLDQTVPMTPITRPGT